ncbi:hypothetical protein BUALT_Bualt05G0061000 [Buddleja alternifolia]|uniref:Reverse transcriptase n=1 Tax=Buddleja alternifolia TaxID=168488 RepID=A0AAV6XGX8_9LAMI|nr:hypothetical protein BUALT_Bualt05G0061000 [Buddleja alternifolia]
MATDGGGWPEKASDMAVVDMESRIAKEVKFNWTGSSWNNGVLRAFSHWKGKHWVNVAYRMLFASIVYMIWKERTERIFSNKSNPPEVVSWIAYIVEDRLLTLQIRESLSAMALKRLWRIAW